MGLPTRQLFKNSGYVVLKNFFSETEKTNIVNAANRLFGLPEVRDSYMKFYENTDKGRILARMEKFYKTDSNIEEIVNNRILPTLNLYEENQMTLFKDKLNWKLPGGGGFKPHQDFEAWSDFPPTYYVTCAIFADECTLDNGCLQMAPDQHQKGILKNTNGCIDKEVTDTFNWKPVLTTPRDMVIFNALVPHTSGKNVSDNTRRIFYFTFNKAIEGSHYEAYFAKKRQELPPDFEREEGKEYNLNSKYNLANPIS